MVIVSGRALLRPLRGPPDIGIEKVMGRGYPVLIIDANPGKLMEAGRNTFTMSSEVPLD
jgi:hypothetical protein